MVVEIIIDNCQDMGSIPSLPPLRKCRIYCWINTLYSFLMILLIIWFNYQLIKN